MKFIIVTGLLEETNYLYETKFKNGGKVIDDKAIACSAHRMGIRDATVLLSGKWEIRIIGSVNLGKKRFMELKAYVDGIAAKMLSKELQELELNGLVNRTVLNTKPITVEYELTEYGHSLKPIIEVIASWGKQHRERVIKGMTEK